MPVEHELEKATLDSNDKINNAEQHVTVAELSPSSGHVSMAEAYKTASAVVNEQPKPEAKEEVKPVVEKPSFDTKFNSQSQVAIQKTLEIINKQKQASQAEHKIAATAHMLAS